MKIPITVLIGIIMSVCWSSIGFASTSDDYNRTRDLYNEKYSELYPAKKDAFYIAGMIVRDYENVLYLEGSMLPVDGVLGDPFKNPRRGQSYGGETFLIKVIEPRRDFIGFSNQTYNANFAEQYSHDFVGMEEVYNNYGQKIPVYVYICNGRATKVQQEFDFIQQKLNELKSILRQESIKKYDAGKDYWGLGLSYTLSGNHQQALESFQKAASEPANEMRVRAQLEVGKELVSLGRYDDAIIALTEYLKLYESQPTEPGRPDYTWPCQAHMLRGEIYAAKDKPELALPNLIWYAEHQFFEGEFGYLETALTYDRLGNVKKAREMYGRYLSDQKLIDGSGDPRRIALAEHRLHDVSGLMSGTLTSGKYTYYFEKVLNGTWGNNGILY